MKNEAYFTLFLLLGLIGEFYIQHAESQKEKRFGSMLLHCLLYSLPFAAYGIICLIFTEGLNAHFTAAVYIISIHTIIELAVFLVLVLFRRKRKKCVTADTLMYIIVQSLHLLSIVAVYLSVSDVSEFKMPEATATADSLSLTFGFICFVLLLLKPANLTLMRLFSSFSPTTVEVLQKTEKPVLQGKPGAGAVIGNLERLLCGSFLLLGQYSAVGLTLTAKSIARYEMISKNPEFSEYYIIGTMFSLLYTIAAYLFIFKFAVFI